MNPVGGSYDESLLREAPAATREQLQVNIITYYVGLILIRYSSVCI